MILGRGGGFVIFLGKCVDVWLELWLDEDMSATEIHNFLTSNPGVEAMRRVLEAEGLWERPAWKGGLISKERAEALLLDLMVARKG